MAEPTKAQFDAAAQKVMASAPDGLSRDDFFALIDQELAPKPGSMTTLGAKTGLGSVAAASNAALRLATGPNVPKVFAGAGRLVGGLAPAATGILTGNPLATVFGMSNAARGAWDGGRTGWHTGKLAQKMAAPIAKALAAVEPAAKTIGASSLIAAQGGLDVAQMMEPNRRDIGVLGVGKSVTTPQITPEQQDAMFVKAVTQLGEQGVSPSKAAEVIAQGNRQTYVRVLNAYIKAQQVKP